VWYIHIFRNRLVVTTEWLFGLLNRHLRIKLFPPIHRRRVPNGQSARCGVAVDAADVVPRRGELLIWLIVLQCVFDAVFVRLYFMVVLLRCYSII
jgi:hypothetical protein